MKMQTEFPCGCYVLKYAGRLDIEYCMLHRSAPDTLTNDRGTSVLRLVAQSNGAKRAWQLRKAAAR